MCQHLQKIQKSVRRELRVKPTLERKPFVFNVGAISVRGLFSKSRERFEQETQDTARKSKVYLGFLVSSNSLLLFQHFLLTALRRSCFHVASLMRMRTELRKERGWLLDDVDGFCSCSFVRLKCGTCSKMIECL